MTVTLDPSDFPPPRRSTWTPSVLPPNYTLAIPLRVIHTPIEPACFAAILYILLSRPMALPTEALARSPSRQRLSFSEIQELASKGLPRTTDEGIVLLVRDSTPTPYSLRQAGHAACLSGEEGAFMRRCSCALRLYKPAI